MSNSTYLETADVQARPLTATATSGDAKPVILLEHVHKVYHLGDIEVPALRGVSLSVARGEFVAVMGPSGSGKSTMMNIIGCLDHPTRGRYLLDSIDVSGLSKSERADIRNQHVGFVFQSFNLLSRTSALENVELPMIYAGVPAVERVQRAREALALVGLAGKESNLPNQLSGGEQQRTAIARSLVNHPSIILADEPTGSLDTRTSVEIMEVFQRLNLERNLTIIIVTHEPDIAEFASRIVLFRDGRIRRDYALPHPKNAAEVLNSMPALTADEDEDEP